MSSPERFRPDHARIQTTGIPRLDAELPDLAAAPGLSIRTHGPDPTPFLFHVLDAHLEARRSALVVLTRRGPGAFVADFVRFGFDAERLRTLVHFLDLRDETGLSNVPRLLADALAVDRTALLVFEDLSPWIERSGMDQVAHWWAKSAVQREGRATLAVLPDAAPAEALDAAWARVVLGRHEVHGTMHDFFRSAGPSAPRIHYLVEQPGGVRPHLRKILITGPHDGGKSTMVKALSERSINVEDLGTTVSLDHGQLVRGGVTIDLYGTPGQERFDPIIHDAALGALGILLVVDSARPATFARAKRLVEDTKALEGPLVVAANKQDQPGAIQGAALLNALGLPASIPVVPCTATDRDSGLAALDVLLAQIRDG